MKDIQLDDPLEFFVQQIRKQLGDHLKQIILFGSRARGDNHPDSDYDCLIVVDELTVKLKMSSTILEGIHYINMTL